MAATCLVQFLSHPPGRALCACSGTTKNQLWLIGSRRAEDKPKAKAIPNTGGLAAESLTRGHAPIHLKNANPNTAAATVGGLTIPLLSAKQTQRGGGSLVLHLLCLL